MDYHSLFVKTVQQLKLVAKQQGVKLPAGAVKNDIINILLAHYESAEAEKASESPVETKTEETASKKRGRPARTAKTDSATSAEKSEVPAKQAAEPEKTAVVPMPMTRPASEPESEAQPVQPVPEVSRHPDVKPAVSELLQSDTCGAGSGVLEILPDGYGFLRNENCLAGNNDVYVSIPQIRRFNLRNGDYLTGKTRPQREGDRSEAMIYIDTVNGRKADAARRRPVFENLTPVFPDSRLRLENRSGETDLALRAIDLIAPIGKGQRGLIVSPPKAGKTVLLKKIANAITDNYPEVKLIVLLIDERPEEVTDMKRSIKGEVMYSTFDEEPEHHTKLSEMTLEYAMRQVEMGDDVVILLDSITRLARAYNMVIPPTGRSLSGGLDPAALYRPKKFFGAARNIENGGSLSIIATALIDTGSRMDDVIYEEFKGTGNMELHLDRKLSERRIFPAIDLNRSGTRRDDLLYTPAEAECALQVRRTLGSGSNLDGAEQLLNIMAKTGDNEEFAQRLRAMNQAGRKGLGNR